VGIVPHARHGAGLRATRPSRRKRPLSGCGTKDRVLLERLGRPRRRSARRADSAAIASARRWTFARSSPSTMTRTTGSVPEGRSSTRPRRAPPPPRATACFTAAAREQVRIRSSFTFTSTCGRSSARA
jgi:hypothetical protein